jgi:hypothetical protein
MTTTTTTPTPRARRRRGTVAAFGALVLALAACQPGVANLDGPPSSTRLVFSRIGTTLTNTFSVHDVASVRFTNNDADKTLTFSSATFTGPWQLAAAGSVPVTIPASGSADIAIRFVAVSGVRIKTGSVAFATSNAEQPTITLELAGHWEQVSEGAEPTLVNVVNDIYGYRTVIVGPGQSIDNDGHVEAAGDEVLSPLWVRSDPTKPATVRQLAAFHTHGAFAFFQWANAGSTTANLVTVHDDAAAQSILPVDPSGLPTAGSFSPPGAFHLKIDGEDSVDANNNQANDLANGCPGPCGHHVRFWPLKDAAGAVVPHSYLVAMDYDGVNYDFNDNVYLVTNITPSP